MQLHFPNRQMFGTVPLGGSKSISNRALMLCNLAEAPSHQFLTGLATAHDTQIMHRILADLHAGTFDAQDAGTVFRFMVARLAITKGTHTLTGSARMKERPIGPLVDAIRQLGAQVTYLKNEGYPPLQITGIDPKSVQISEITVQADVSSQFVSALLMIAPLLRNGCKLNVPEPRVSWSYVKMTIALMQKWGIRVNDDLHVPPAAYQPTALQIEPDWSAASYWCSLAALSNEAELFLPGLQMIGSVQGDAAIVKPYQRLGLEFLQQEDGVRIIKLRNVQLPHSITLDFTEMPDVAQTLAVTCAGLGVTGVFSGLSTLAIKETDRIQALKTELARIGVTLTKLPSYMSKKGQQYLFEGKAKCSPDTMIETYGDHRMAMSFAALAALGQPIGINQPEVVSKSYPEFWDHLRLVMR